MGGSLARGWSAAGERVELASGRAPGAEEAAAIAGAAGTVVLAVPDDAIAEVAARLARQRAITASHVVLHLSGRHDRTILTPLAGTGAALGSLHPLQTVPTAQFAPDRWRGAYAALEGDPRAVQEAGRLASLLGLAPIVLPPGAKLPYHAGAVIASNYLVVLAEFAARVARQAGLEPALAARIYLPLMRGALESLDQLSPPAALTGPIRRGDLETVRAHLGALGEDDREAYARLGLEAVRLAEAAGLGREPAEALRNLLRGAAQGERE